MRINDLGQIISFLVRISTLSPELITRFSELELIEGTLTETQAGLATSFAIFVEKIMGALPVIGTVAGIIAAIGAAVVLARKDIEAHDLGYAVERTKEEIKSLQDLKAESERTARQIQDLNAQKASGDFTEQQQVELELLKAQRKVLEDQVALYQGRVDAAKSHERDTALRAANSVLNPTADDELYGSTLDQALVSYSFALEKLTNKPDNAGYNRLFEHASGEVLRYVEMINNIIASLDPETDSDVIDKLSAKLKEINSTLGVTEDVVHDIITETENLTEGAGDAANKDGFVFSANENKEMAKFKKQLQSLRVDIIKTLGEGKTLTQEQSFVFDQWISKMGYAKDDAEQLVNLFATLFNETPPDRITSANVIGRLQDARRTFEQLRDEVSKYNIDFDRTVYGNIDVSNRQLLEWTEENLNRFRDALDSWRNPEIDGDLASMMQSFYGSTSTVLGTSEGFDTNKGVVEIAFSPILQTDKGPELLSADSVHSYIESLIDEATEGGTKTDWEFGDILKLDAKGIEVDGKKIKGLLADIGNQARETGEIMHYLGKDGALQQSAKELADATSSAFAYMRYYILDNVGDLGSLRDEINNVSKAMQEYQAILAGGDPADQANQFSAAWKKAMDDIDLGRINTNAVWGAAKLFFTDEQLAKWRYDLNRIAQELNSDFIRYLFAPPDEGEDAIDPGVKFAQYIKAHEDQFSAAHILGDPNTGGFTFWYDSLEKLADEFGLSEEAVVSMLHALEAFGVHSIQSGEDVEQLARKYEELYRIAGDASAALHDLVLGFATGDNPLNEAQIMSNLQTLRANGVITGDDEEFTKVIQNVMETLQKVNEETATPHVWLEGTEQTKTDAENLMSALKTIFSEPVVVTLIADDSDVVNKANSAAGGSSGVQHNASGTKDAPAGVSLVNELGPELISDNGAAYIANGGKPGFTYLNKGAIVFTAAETRDIFRNGRSDIHVNAYANGTNGVSRKTIRDRLIGGGKIRGLYTGGVSKTFTCVKCGHSWNYSPIDYPSGPTGACPKCGAYYSNGSYQYGGNTVSPEHQYDDYYAYDVTTGNPIDNYDEIYDDYASHGYYGPQDPLYDSGYVHEKRCPNCGKAVGFNVMVCPNCGYNFSTGRIDKAYQSKANLNFQKALQKQQKQASGGRSGYSGSGGGSSVGSADYGSQADPQKVDWIAVILNRIQKKIADLEKVASSGFKSLDTRLKAADDEMTAVAQEISLQRQAYERYMNEAAGVGLSDDLAQLVRDGAIDINEYDDDTRELIDKYSEWYEKALDSKYAIEELTQDIADLFVDMFNATQTDFENQLSFIEHRTNMIEKNMQEATARGYLDSIEYYKQLTDLESESIAKMETELAVLNQRFREAMDSGTIEEYSEAWYSMAQNINAVEESIRDANIQILEYAKTMRSIQWGYFDYMMSEFGQLQSEANFLIGVMANDKLFDEIGRFADKGTATIGLHVMNYNAYMKQADEYAEEMRKIERGLESNPYDTELIERRKTLLGLQQQMIQASEAEKDAMRDLVSQGIQLELNALKELIEEYEKSLDGAKNLYDYQKKITDKTSDVAKIQKQLTAYQGDDSEENRSRIQKLQEELKEAQEDLEETEYEQSIADQKKLLAELYDEYEQYLNQRLDNLESLVQQMVDGVNMNADTIRDELVRTAEQVGYTISNSMSGVLDSGVYSYYDKMFNGVTSITGYLDSINQMVARLIDAADNTAKNNASYAAPSQFATPKDDDSIVDLGNDIKARELGNGLFEELTPYVNNKNEGGDTSYITVLGKRVAVTKEETANGVGDLVRFTLVDNPSITNAQLMSVLKKDPDQLKRILKDMFNKGFSDRVYFDSDFKNVALPFSTGGLADYTGLAMLHGTKTKPEIVLNPDDTEKFLTAAKLMRAPVFDALLNKSLDLNALAGSGDMRGGDFNFGDLNIQIDHVQDYNDFVTKLRDDPKFEKLIDAIVFDPMNGKTSFGGKNKLKW